MGHSIIHDQSAKRRDSVRLRFLDDYVVFDFYITSFLVRCILLEKFIFSRIRKDEGQGKEKCHVKSMISKEANERLKETLSMCCLCCLL
jgi:hypothetical protein